MTRQDMIDNLKCNECGMNTTHKMDCSSKDAFNAFKKALIWLPYMSNEQLAQINFECWAEAQNRAAMEIEQDVEKAIDNIKKNN